MSKLFRKAAKTPIPAGKRDIHVADDELPGFYIRKYDSGKQSFIVKYALRNGKQRKLALGAATAGGESEARKKATSILLKAKIGEDFVGEIQATAARQETSVKSLITKYLKKKGRGSQPSPLCRNPPLSGSLCRAASFAGDRRGDAQAYRAPCR